MAIASTSNNAASAPEKAASAKPAATGAHHRHGKPHSTHFSNALQDLLSVDIAAQTGTPPSANAIERERDIADGAADKALSASMAGAEPLTGGAVAMDMADVFAGVTARRDGAPDATGLNVAAETKAQSTKTLGQGHADPGIDAVEQATVSSPTPSMQAMQSAMSSPTPPMQAMQSAVSSPTPPMQAMQSAVSTSTGPMQASSMEWVPSLDTARNGLPNAAASVTPADAVQPLAQHVAAPKKDGSWRAGVSSKMKPLNSVGVHAAAHKEHGAGVGATTLSSVAAQGVAATTAASDGARMRADVMFRLAPAGTPSSTLESGAQSTMAFAAEGYRRVVGVDRGPDQSINAAHGTERSVWEGGTDAQGLAETSVAAESTLATVEFQEQDAPSLRGDWGPQSAHLRLHDDSGSAVNVSIQLAGNQVQVDFSAAEPAMQQALAHSQSQLSDLLLQEGMQLAGLSIQAGMGDSSQPQRGQPESLDGTSLRQGGGKPERRGEATPHPGARSARGHLDVFV